MSTPWREWVGQQLNTLVAIGILGIIAIVALVTRQEDVTITMACVTGIAGVAGTIQRGVGGRSTDPAPRPEPAEPAGTP